MRDGGLRQPAQRLVVIDIIAHDDTCEPGKTYHYRIRYQVLNPLFGMLNMVKNPAMAQQFSLPSAYDAHYLALAESRQCECWTADERLWNTVKNALPWVRWLGQQAAPAET